MITEEMGVAVDQGVEALVEGAETPVDTVETNTGADQEAETPNPNEDENQGEQPNPDEGADDGQEGEGDEAEQNQQNEMITNLQSENEQMRQQLDQIAETNQRVMQLWEQFPEIPAMIQDLNKGATLAEAAARHLDLDELKPMEGDADYEAWNKAKNERAERLNSLQEQQKMLDENLEFSVKEMNEFKAENNLTDEQAEEFFNNVNEFLDQIFAGKVDRKVLGMFQKAMNADKTAAESAKQAEIKAKNEKIEAKRKTDTSRGDNLPKLNKGAEVSEPEEDDMAPPADPFASAFDRQRTRQRF